MSQNAAGRSGSGKSRKSRKPKHEHGYLGELHDALAALEEQLGEDHGRIVHEQRERVAARFKE